MLHRALPFLEYAFAAAVSFALCAMLYGTWQSDLSVAIVPVVGDYAQYMATIFKGMLDNPWYSFNAYVGAPSGLDLYGFPVPDLLFLLWVKAMTMVTHNPFRIANWALTASFPLTTLPALFVLRKLGVRYSIAFTAATLFSFSSFHHMRNMGHILFAVSYYTVAPATLVALALIGNESFFLAPGVRWWRPRLALRSGRSILVALIALLIGLTGSVYFPFFSSFCILTAGVVAAVRHQSPTLLYRTGAVLGVIGIGFLINVSPILYDFHIHGKPAALVRVPSDSEQYGLKITQLVLPVSGHRLQAFRDLKNKYDTQFPLVNENITEALGLVGTLGFLYLLCTLLLSRKLPPGAAGGDQDESLPRDAVSNPEIMHGLGVLNLAVILLGTIGGAGALFALFISPQIRSYNRISVYIAFFSLTALALLVERAARKSRFRTFVRHGLPLLSAVVLVLGVLDQAPAMATTHEDTAQACYNDQKFVHGIEATVAPGSMIFQLPYVTFPENGPVNHLTDYALFRPYLYSDTLRWSYGSTRGTPIDTWNKETSTLPGASMVERLRAAGFAGIHLARDGYPDHGAALEADLGSVLGPPAVVSPNGDVSFFALTRH